MKKLLILLFLLPVLVLRSTAQQGLQSVNPLLLDESYMASYGNLPDAGTDEDLRVSTHLAYTEQLLRARQTAALTDAQRIKRSFVLDLLHSYQEAGVFPRNYDYADERKPCFIDRNGTICAVGYLIEQTKGRELAEAINARHQYDQLLDMKEPAIAEWADEFGLTLEECAMIQPAYGPPPPAQTSYADIKQGYGISSGMLGGANLAFNIAQFAGRGKYGSKLAYLGLVTGTGQLILGLANVKKSDYTAGINGYDSYTSYKKQNNLSYVNIALGTTTLITSAINLALNKKVKDKRNAFNLYSYPNYSNSMTMGLSFTRAM